MALGRSIIHSNRSCDEASEAFFSFIYRLGPDKASIFAKGVDAELGLYRYMINGIVNVYLLVLNAI